MTWMHKPVFVAEQNKINWICEVTANQWGASVYRPWLPHCVGCNNQLWFSCFVMQKSNSFSQTWISIQVNLLASKIKDRSSQGQLAQMVKCALHNILSPLTVVQNMPYATIFFMRDIFCTNAWPWSLRNMSAYLATSQIKRFRTPVDTQHLSERECSPNK